jgi:transcriptional regulator with XRE-family HTH domain
MLSSEQIRAARALLRWEQKDLADASGISLPSIKRLETQKGELAAQPRTIDALRRALVAAGISFIDDHATSAGGGPGVRLAASPNAPMSDDETAQYKEYLNPDASFGSGG